MASDAVAPVVLTEERLGKDAFLKVALKVGKEWNLLAVQRKVTEYPDGEQDHEVYIGPENDEERPFLWMQEAEEEWSDDFLNDLVTLWNYAPAVAAILSAQSGGYGPLRARLEAARQANKDFSEDRESAFAYAIELLDEEAKATSGEDWRARCEAAEAENVFLRCALSAIYNNASREWLLENGMEGDAEIGMVNSFWSQKEAIFAERVAMRANSGTPAYLRERNQGGR